MDGNAFEIVAGDDFGAGFKTCTQCGEEKPLAEFHKDASGRMGRKGKCKACLNPINRRAKRKEYEKKTGGISREEIINAVADKLIDKMGL